MARKTARMLAAGATVLLVTFLFHNIVPVNVTTIGFAYLITILLIAAWWGLSASLVASITATLSLNFFFLPPTGAWTIADPENWIALVSFLICSLVASQLSDRAQRRTAEAQAVMLILLENARSRDMAARAEAARQSEEFKSTLLDGLAHEFKTPLTCIKAAATALLSPTASKPEQREELLTIVDQEADRLSRLVSETIQLARIEAGNVQLNIQPCSVRSLIESTVEQMESRRNGRHIEIIVADGIPEIRADADLTQLALRQLLDNALKYSAPRTPILVRARSFGTHVDIAVHNNGEPLSNAEQERVFEKFYRGKNVKNRISGTGMGLAIARQIVVAHGGDIHLESGEGGTQFVAVLPA